MHQYLPERGRAFNDLEILNTVVAIGGGLIGAIGGIVGIVTAVRSSRKENLKEIEEQNDFSFLAAFMQTQMGVGPHVGQIFTAFEIGSKEWQRAEKMVERGILKRGPNGHGYHLPGFYEKGKTHNSPSR